MNISVLDSFLVCYGLSGLPLGDEFDISYYDSTPEESIMERIQGAQAVFVNRTPLSAAVFASPALRFVGTFGTGYNHIDLDAAQKAGVTVCNVPAYSTHAVAQHTISLLLNICCQTAAHDRYLKQTGWDSLNDPALVNRGSFELLGKTLGLIGYGDIARQVGRIARALGMEVLAYRRNPVWEADVTFVSLETLLEQSHVVSLHCPLTPQTTKLIGRDAIARMRQGAVLLNTARGAVLDSEAVKEALDSGKLFMAGIDVFDREPTGDAHPLAAHARVIATPHIAWAPDETRARVLRISAENLLAFLRGTPQNVVSHPTQTVSLNRMPM